MMTEKSLQDRTKRMVGLIIIPISLISVMVWTETALFYFSSQYVFAIIYFFERKSKF